MKRYLNFIAVMLMGTVVLSSCEKNENKVYYEGGTPPVLTASSTGTIVLLPANAANPGMKFTWTNPNYRFTTGISSQDISYSLQADTTGSNFSKPVETSISKDLSISMTVKEFNAIFSRMNILENIPHNIEFRIKSSLTNNSAVLYSNVIKMVITPYLDVAVPIPPTGELYITGSATASDWTNSPPATQKFTKVSNTEYNITVPFVPGKEYKFLSTLSNWQPQYGTTNATGTELGGEMGYNMGGGSDPASIKTPTAAGMYKITVNFKSGQYTVVKQ
jgi:starch-binding outer membrane protein SusE/F